MSSKLVPLRLWILDKYSGRSITYFITNYKSLSIQQSAYDDKGYIISFKSYNKTLCVFARQFNIVGGIYGN